MFVWLESWGERLLAFNIAVAIAAKLLVPWGSDGLATITAPLEAPDTGVILAATNAERVVLKLVPLERSAALDAAAAAKLSDMAAQGYFAHVAPDGRAPWDFIAEAGYTYRAAGENLAKGFSDMAAVVPAWMRSSSHKANIVNAGYRHIGLAAARVAYRGSPTTLVVQMFGSPQAAPAAKPKTVPPSAQAPQRVSTESAIRPVTGPLNVTTPAGATTASITATLNGWLAIWLSLFLVVLTAALAVRGTRRPLVVSWLGTTALLAVVALVPALKAGQGLIF